MESVGSQLREARLKLGLTIEQVSAKTRISTKNLQAIENDDPLSISSAFFFRSFVRQFAEELKLDYSVLAPAVQQVTSAMPEPLMPGQVLSGEQDIKAPKVASIKVSRPKNLRWLYSLLSFVLMLVACSSFYGVWEQSRSDWRGSLTALIHSVILAPRTTRLAPVQQSVAQLTPALSESPQISEGNAAFHVELSANERTWLSIVADGTETFSGVLQAAETKILEGHEIARVRTGNAGAISFVFNGKLIGSLGPRGQVRTVVFTKDNYEVLEASPRVALTHFSPSGE